MNFFETSKMILEQMLQIVISRIKFTKLKNKLRDLADLKPPDKLPQKQEEKINNLKTVAFLIANICD